MNFPNTKPKLVAAIPNELIKGPSITPKEVIKTNRLTLCSMPPSLLWRLFWAIARPLKKPAPLDVVVTTAPEPTDYDLFRAIFGLQMEGTKTRLLAQFKQA